MNRPLDPTETKHCFALIDAVLLQAVDSLTMNILVDMDRIARTARFSDPQDYLTAVSFLEDWAAGRDSVAQERIVAEMRKRAASRARLMGLLARQVSFEWIEEQTRGNGKKRALTMGYLPVLWDGRQMRVIRKRSSRPKKHNRLRMAGQSRPTAFERSM